MVFVGNTKLYYKIIFDVSCKTSHLYDYDLKNRNNYYKIY